MGEFDADDIGAGDHDGSEVVMTSEILSPFLCSIFRGETCGRRELQLLVVDIIELVVEGTVVGGDDFGHRLMQDQIRLVIHTHEFALKLPLVLSDHPQPLADVLLLEGALCLACLALEGRIILLHID